MDTSGSGTEHTRSRTVTYVDPAATAQVGRSMSGLEFLRGMADGTVPPPPIAVLMSMDIVSVEPGHVVFGAVPDASHHNPIGMVHGGFAATLLDTVCGCAVHSTLPAGTAYSTIEIKVSYLRPVQAGARLVATGTVTRSGSRVAFAEAQLTTEDGTLVATASSSLLVIEPRTA
ncbi:MAG TPA: PaaI family thioesterase [Actinotalea caeni]|uniref:PaaI family thioesterase n=1 Tax=Actinotalea caeni TaxID=1348467 RepID=UPI0012E24BB3|nr:PaaI family thioesterase [Actinotalea caeni]HLV55332.1 PaaI family thioesterase [Actinotalea caeni]